MLPDLSLSFTYPYPSKILGDMRVIKYFQNGQTHLIMYSLTNQFQNMKVYLPEIQFKRRSLTLQASNRPLLRHLCTPYIAHLSSHMRLSPHSTFRSLPSATRPILFLFSQKPLFSLHPLTNSKKRRMHGSKPSKASYKRIGFSLNYNCDHVVHEPLACWLCMGTVKEKKGKKKAANKLNRRIILKLRGQDNLFFCLS